MYITTLAPKIIISPILKYSLESISKMTPSFVKNKKLGGNPAILSLKASSVFDFINELPEEGLNGDNLIKETVIKVLIWKIQYKTKKYHIRDSLEIRLITTQDIE